MAESNYRLSYLPLFYEDMAETLEYITNRLQSPKAALDLLDETERAIGARLLNPTGAKPYDSRIRRDSVYYPIYVKNYIVFYVILGDVMEVRRFIYGRRDIDRHL